MIAATKRWLRIIAGWCLIIAGIIMIPLPGPGLLVILGGLTVLSSESAWAHSLMERLKEYLRSKRGKRMHCEKKSSSS